MRQTLNTCLNLTEPRCPAFVRIGWPGVSEMAQRAKVLAKQGQRLSSSPGTHWKVEGDN